MKPIRPLIFLVASLLALSAAAQWQWLDKDGRRVFSDLPPPADIPQKNILKQPAARGGVATAPAASPATAPGSAAEAAAKPADVDKSLQDKKKQTEEAEAAKRKAEEERIAKAKADNCSRAQKAMAALESGTRLSRLNDKGEREFFDDAARAAETERMQSIINENCK